ncbi:MAG: hypothetical protein ABMA02_13320 [Saprospiraceae bacterium]
MSKPLFFTHACGFLFLLACHAGLPPDRYRAWVASNRESLTATSAGDAIQTTLTYLPADWLAINEVGLGDPEKISSARGEYVGLEYYRLRVALQSGQGDVLQHAAAGTDDYYQRIEYFSFGMQHDIRLLVGPDTLACKLYHFERNYGAAPYMDFMLGFETKPGSEFDRTLLYDDRVYSSGLIHLTIPFDNIHCIPTLQL